MLSVLLNIDPIFSDTLAKKGSLIFILIKSLVFFFQDLLLLCEIEAVSTEIYTALYEVGHVIALLIIIFISISQWLYSYWWVDPALIQSEFDMNCPKYKLLFNGSTTGPHQTCKDGSSYVIGRLDCWSNLSRRFCMLEEVQFYRGPWPLMTKLSMLSMCLSREVWSSWFLFGFFGGGSGKFKLIGCT